MTQAARALLDRLWDDYRSINPWADTLRAWLVADGGRLVHDHVALRTVSHPKFGIARTARPFEEAGYALAGEYEFPSKRLVGRHYEVDDPDLPKVFITELQLEACTRSLKDMMSSLGRGLDPDAWPVDAFAIGGRLWNPILHEVYDRLREESKYAAWIAAFGFRAHRFAVLVNALEGHRTLPDILDYLWAHGLDPLDAGGDPGRAVRGSPEAGLERASTRAIPTTIRLGDGPVEIPGPRDAFVVRHPTTDGTLFHGFLDESATTSPPEQA
jgi:hypothetical protein